MGFMDENEYASDGAETILRAGRALGAPIPAGGTTAIVVPDGYHVQSLEGLGTWPTSKRGRASFDDVPSFVAYVNAHKAPGTAIAYQIAAQPTLRAVLDGHSVSAPGWGRHTAALVFTYSRQFKAWHAISGRAQTQAEIAEFIEERIGDIAEPAGAVLFEMIRAFTVSKQIEYSAVHNLQSGGVELVYRDVEGAAGKASTVRVPDVITLAIPIFDGDERVAVSVRFRHRLQDGGKLTITFKMTQIDDVIEAAVVQRVREVQAGTSITPWRGTLPENLAPVDLPVVERR